MITLITTLQIFACLILIISVILQPSKGGSALGGSSQSVFGSTGGTTFLFRTTMIMAAFIMVSSLYLSRYRIQQARSSIINGMTFSPKDTVPSVPTAPATTPSPADAQAPAAAKPSN